MNRRGFLGGLLAAPAIVRAEFLMKIWVPPKEVLTFQGRMTDVRFSKHAVYNFPVQGQASRILYPAHVTQAYQEAFIRNLETPQGFFKLLTIEYR